MPYSELRPDRVPGRDRHLVRGAAGRRGRRAPARRRPDADARPGRVDPRALGDRRGRLRAAAPSARSGATRSPAGASSTSRAALDLLGNEGTSAAARCLRAERRRRQQRPTRSAAAADDHATLDYWDDPIDVYAIALTKGETVFARLNLGRVPNWLTLWQPGTMHVTGPERIELSEQSARGATVGGQERLAYRRPGQRHLLPRGAGRRRHARRRRLPACDRGRPHGGRTSLVEQLRASCVPAGEVAERAFALVLVLDLLRLTRSGGQELGVCALWLGSRASRQRRPHSRRGAAARLASGPGRGRGSGRPSRRNSGSRGKIQERTAKV